MSAETKYKEIMNRFNADVSAAVKKAADEIHSDIIPHINDDTEYNAIYRARDIVNSILRGNFEVEGNQIICDGWNTRMTSNYHDKLVDKLAAATSDKAKDLLIKRLSSQLAEAYNPY